MIKAIDCKLTILHSLECSIFDMNEGEKIKVLAIILYPHEPYDLLTTTQLDKIRNIINEFK